MKLIFKHLFILPFFLLAATKIHAQGKIYTFEKDKEYFTLELDTDVFPTWGTYRALNHHSIAYFEITFLADKQVNPNGSELLVMVPTYYNYAYLYDVKGQPDTLNMKKQNLKFYFYVKDKDKKLEYIAPDSTTRRLLLDNSSFNKKREIDITSFPREMKLVKNAKWHKFPLELRFNLSDKFEHKQKGGFGNK